MSRLIESIYWREGKFRNPGHHQDRMNCSFEKLFPGRTPWNIEQVLMKQHSPDRGLFKCRLLYDEQSISVDWKPYTIPVIHTLKMVAADSLQYAHKFEDRTEINRLFNQQDEADDILIIKNGMVTDTSNANIVFKKDAKWFTPSTCLLDGVMREALLERSMIASCEISAKAISQFESFKLINAMVGFDLEEQDISNIF